eukprot:scaffold10306_cov104-Isochrysis_galbana.AAC.3
MARRPICGAPRNDGWDRALTAHHPPPYCRLAGHHPTSRIRQSMGCSASKSTTKAVEDPKQELVASVPESTKAEEVATPVIEAPPVEVPAAEAPAEAPAYMEEAPSAEAEPEPEPVGPAEVAVPEEKQGVVEAVTTAISGVISAFTSPGKAASEPEPEPAAASAEPEPEPAAASAEPEPEPAAASAEPEPEPAA